MMFKRIDFSRKSTLFVLLVSTASLLSNNCVSIIGRKTQSVGFTSRPYGAKVYIDGKFAGEAPLKLKLHKRSPHTVRIEKEGYRPVEIMLKSRVSWGPVLVTNLIWSIPCALLAFSYGFDAQSRTREKISLAFTISILAAPIAAILIDAKSSKSRQFTSHINVFLEKDRGNGQPAVLEMDADDFRKVTWISVLCETDGPGEK